MTANNFSFVALRLACLGETDREWIYSRLSSDEVARIRTLIADLQQSGLASDVGVLKEVADGAGLTLCLPNHDDQEDLLALFESIKKPAWRAMLARYLGESGTHEANRRFFADNPFVYRQLINALDGSKLPVAWLGAFKTYSGNLS